MDIKDLSEQRWVSAPCHDMCGCFGLPTHCSGPFYPYSGLGKGQGRDVSLRSKSFSYFVLWSVCSQCLTVDGNGFGLETIHLLCKWDVKIMCLGFLIWVWFFFFPLKHRAYSCLNAKREREVVCNVLAGCVFIILAVAGLLSEVLNL